MEVGEVQATQTAAPIALSLSFLFPLIPEGERLAMEVEEAPLPSDARAPHTDSIPSRKSIPKKGPTIRGENNDALIHRILDQVEMLINARLEHVLARFPSEEPLRPPAGEKTWCTELPLPLLPLAPNPKAASN